MDSNNKQRMKNSFLSVYNLNRIGFKSFGKNVLISRKASIYSPEKIIIGNNVRIDDFCILSGSITIGSFVHVSAYSALYGSKGIVLEDFSGLSPRVTIFSAIDDFSGEFLINPMVPEELTNISGNLVKISKFCQVGSNSIIFPGITIQEGTVVGALSLVKENLNAWSIYAGIPARFLKERKKDLILKVKDFFQ